ncbi:MAG: hypothetical protein KC414_09905, partial [Romboutsia sp.]|nr:hypothetical protein [Romboutsia sp.]
YNSYRLALVTVTDGVSKFVKNVLFSDNNASEIESSLVNITTGGGGSAPEPTDLALDMVLDGGMGEFRINSTKMVILVTDALPSGDDDFYNLQDWDNVQLITSKAVTKGVMVNTFLTSSIEPPIEINGFPTTSYIMNYYATQTGGNYSFNSLGKDISSSIIDNISKTSCEETSKCYPIPDKVGKFGYWESVDNYPDNEDLYNSNNLLINPNDVPLSIKAEFEEYFTNGQSDGYYNLKSETDFRCTPIRHYRFPDFCVSPFMSDTSNGVFQDSYIYPIGVTIDEEVVNFFLDVAVQNNLITQEQRDKLDKFEIFRGDRTLHKGIIAKGLAYDMYKYNESDESTDILYPNYPYNDLGEDDLHYTSKDRNSLIQHPFGGVSNNRFTFHSPDTHFHKPTLPSEIKVEAYQFGDSKGQFVQVDEHSKWVILTQEAYDVATILATAEVLAEIAVRYGDFQVQNAIAGDRVYEEMEYGKVGRETKTTEDFNAGIVGNLSWSVAGTVNGGSITGTPQTLPDGTVLQPGKVRSTDQENETTGKAEENYDDYGGNVNTNNGTQSNPTTGFVSIDPSISRTETTDGNKGTKGTDVNVDKLSTLEKIFVIASIIGTSFNKLGQYRYEWLKIFKDNGQPENFAFYYTSEGWYNKAICNPTEGDMIRGISAKRYLKPGRHRINEINATDALKINNVNRESSVFLSFGDNYNINYPAFYTGIDNSRFESSDVGVGNGIDIDLGQTDDDGNDLFNFSYDARSPEVIADIASPYISLKDYVPNQYGEVESIKWIPTGFCGHLDGGSTCPRIFGGDIFISRFSLKRKIPLFLTTAINLANLTPFNYYPYRNIGHPVYYCDY